MGSMLGKLYSSMRSFLLCLSDMLMAGSPGRWLVAHQLKLMLAYVTLDYDIQYIAKRLVNRNFGDSIIPSPTATMTVRRRKQTGGA